jgi:carbamoyl-phosphate synthase small subunit
VKAVLALADGTIFRGKSFGATGTVIGEVVFDTAMSGYQETLTDPSFKGQLVTMTFPEIGNTGINDEDEESYQAFVSGFIVKQYNEMPSNWRSNKSLGSYMKERNIIGIEGLDTRALTRRLRNVGSQMGVISTEDIAEKELVARAAADPGLGGKDTAGLVATQNNFDWKVGTWNLEDGYAKPQNAKYKVITLDCGVKYNALRHLTSSGCDVTAVPPKTPAEAILEMNPNGIFVSSGPGDPEGVPYVIETVSKLIGKLPIFGICLGHQILCLAMGGSTYKLKFGHHGLNHPVAEIGKHKVEITSQNHNYAVDIESLGGQVVQTHINLNDQTCEGMRHVEYPIFSVQYHPESSPGPHDASYLIDRFVENMGK